MGDPPMRMALILFVLPGFLVQGEPPPGHAGTHAPVAHHAEAEGPAALEAEFLASDIFRSGSYIQPLYRQLSFEGHYFGGKFTDTGYTGASWTFHRGGWKLSPGAGVLFGSNKFTTTAAFSFRWEYERGWFITQGLLVQGFRQSPVFHEEEGHHASRSGDPEPVSYVRPTITDGDHVSARWKRLTVGGSWEHIHFREGNEWKGGPRFAVRMLPRLSAVLYLLYPGRAEWRAGLLFHPRAEH